MTVLTLLPNPSHYFVNVKPELLIYTLRGEFIGVPINPCLGDLQKRANSGVLRSGLLPSSSIFHLSLSIKRWNFGFQKWKKRFQKIGLY